MKAATLHSIAGALCGGPAVLAGALLGAALAAGPAAADPVDLTMAVLPSPNSLYTAMMDQVPDRIAKATDGQVKVTLNDSLIGGPQITAAVRDGRVPMSGALHTYLAAEEPRMGLFNLPGLVKGMADYAYLCEAFWCGDVAKLWQDKWNSVVLAQGAWCTQQLFSREPIRRLEDFKNKKLRVHNPQTATMMAALGAKPTPMALSEIPPALERGVIDGVFTSACYGNGQEYWRLAKYVQDWKLGPITGWAIIINKEAWEAIPAEQRAKIRTAMQQLQHDAMYDYYSHVNKALANMRANKVDVWEAPESELKRVFEKQYVDATFKSFYDRAKEVGFDGEAYVRKAREVLGQSAAAD